MIKAKAILLILGVSLFNLACQKEQEGFPKSEKDKFTTRFIFKNNYDPNIKDFRMTGYVYYPLEQETLTQYQDFEDKKWVKNDSVVMEFREAVYTDCKLYMKFEVTYTKTVIVDKETTYPVVTETFLTSASPINYGNKDFIFNWPDERDSRAIIVSE